MKLFYVGDCVQHIATKSHGTIIDRHGITRSHQSLEERVGSKLTGKGVIRYRIKWECSNRCARYPGDQYWSALELKLVASRAQRRRALGRHTQVGMLSDS